MLGSKRLLGKKGSWVSISLKEGKLQIPNGFWSHSFDHTQFQELVQFLKDSGIGATLFEDGWGWHDSILFDTSWKGSKFPKDFFTLAVYKANDIDYPYF